MVMVMEWECLLQNALFARFCFIIHSIQPQSIQTELRKYLHYTVKIKVDECFIRVEWVCLCVCVTKQRSMIFIEIGNRISRMEMQVERFVKAIEIHFTWTDFMEYFIHSIWCSLYVTLNSPAFQMVQLIIAQRGTYTHNKIHANACTVIRDESIQKHFEFNEFLINNANKKKPLQPFSFYRNLVVTLFAFLCVQWI